MNSIAVEAIAWLLSLPSPPSLPQPLPSLPTSVRLVIVTIQYGELSNCRELHSESDEPNVSSDSPVLRGYRSTYSDLYYSKQMNIVCIRI